MKGRLLLEGTGASLLVFTLFQVLLSDYPIYTHQLPVTNLIGGFLIAFVLLAALIAALLHGIDLLPQTPQRILLALFAGFIIWRFLDSGFSFLNALIIEPRYKVYFWQPVRIPIFLAILLVSLASACFFSRFAVTVTEFVRVLVAASACATLCILPHLVRAMVAQEPRIGTLPVNSQPSLPGASGKRIIWILFDELSYDQTFDHPQPSVSLPTFNRLRGSSFSFSNVTPSGYYTALIIPSLFIGRQFTDTRRTPEGKFLYKTAAQHDWVSYAPADTLFGVARQLGWTTGVVGWLNPYCRIIGPVLDTCFWAKTDGSLLEPFGASEDKSMLRNAAALPVWAFTSLTLGAREYPAEHIADYEAIMRHAGSMIADGRIRFLFIHLPIPHPPGIYDRRANRIQPAGSYLDNLVLADQAAATLLSEIASTPAAAQTTIVLSSDHSLRTPMWQASDAWTAEDEKATGGRFDERPVFMVQFPGQSSAATVNAEFPELAEHDIFDAMLRGKLSTPADLTSFLSTTPAAKHGPSIQGNR